MSLPISTTTDLDDLLASPAPVSLPPQVVTPQPSYLPAKETSPRHRGHSKDEQAEAAKREEQAKRELREKAAAELAAWNEQRQKNLQLIRDSHRMHAPAPQNEPGSTWEKGAAIVEAIPLQPAGGAPAKDVSKFRSLLISLKNSPPVAF